MKILIDECLPRMLARWLPGQEVVTVQEAGWAGVKNGELLDLAEGLFDAFLTADQRLKYQQNLADRTLAVVVLPSNRLALVEELVPVLRETLGALAPGRSGQYVEMPLPQTHGIARDSAGFFPEVYPIAAAETGGGQESRAAPLLSYD